MEIMVAKHAGFCFGVKRAIEIAEEVAEKNRDKTAYVYGQLVHNERVIDELEKKGIVFSEQFPGPFISISVLTGCYKFIICLFNSPGWGKGVYPYGEVLKMKQRFVMV